MLLLCALDRERLHRHQRSFWGNGPLFLQDSCHRFSDTLWAWLHSGVRCSATLRLSSRLPLDSIGGRQLHCPLGRRGSPILLADTELHPGWLALFLCRSVGVDRLPAGCLLIDGASGMSPLPNRRLPFLGTLRRPASVVWCSIIWHALANGVSTMGQALSNPEFVWAEMQRTRVKRKSGT